MSILNINQARALLSVRDGAYVYSIVTAKRLREVQAIEPTLVDIIPVEDSADHVKVPYFDAKATKDGLFLAMLTLKHLNPYLEDGFTDIEKEAFGIFKELQGRTFVPNDLSNKIRNFLEKYWPC